MAMIYQGVVTYFEANKSGATVSKEQLEAAQQFFDNFPLTESEEAALQGDVKKIHEDFDKDIDNFMTSMGL